VAAHRSRASGLTQLLDCLAALAAEGTPVRFDRLFMRTLGGQRIELASAPRPSRPGPATCS
jgi:hypothetical protein